jgi:acyl carrier protein
MNQQVFLAQLDEILEFPAGTLTGSEALADLEDWDSLAMMNFIALTQEQYDVTLSPRQIAPCITVNDLIQLATKAA